MIDRTFSAVMLAFAVIMVGVVYFAYQDMQNDKVRAREHCAESFDPPLCEATYLNR